MQVTGTVSDFDAAGGFGLITADDGELLPFSVRDMPPVLQDNMGVGTRVRFSRQDAEPAARAIQIVIVKDRKVRDSTVATLQPPKARDDVRRAGSREGDD
jgi:hypothetical protein